MFEVISWTYRFVYIFLTAAFSLSCYLVYLKNKKNLGYFLPVINVMIIAMSFALLSISEPVDYTAIYIGSGLVVLYIISRLAVRKLLNTESRLLFDIVFHLLSIGLTMLYRLSPEYGIRQSYYVIAGIFSFFAVLFIMKKISIEYKHKLMLGGIILILLLLTQFFGTEISGSKNWIKLSFVNVQPSEFIKLLFVFFIACVLENQLDLKMFIKISAAVLTVIAFFVLQRDLGSAFIFFAVYIAVLFVNDRKYYYTAISACVAALGGIVSYFTFSYVQYRVLAWVNPWKYIAGKSYQITQSLFAVASGGLIGTGLYLGNPKYIPAVHTDFIFSAIAEETGILGAIILLSLYILLTYISMDIALKTESKLYSNAVLGLASLTAIQTLIIVCGVLNIIPITGVTLPFISYGGSSLLSQFINIGLICSLNTKNEADLGVDNVEK